MAKKIIKAISLYYRSHMWCSFASSIFLTIFLLVIVFQLYLKNEYISYLISNNQTTEESVLEIAVQNMNQSIENCIQVGAEISVDDTLYPLLEAFITGKDSAAYYRQQLYLTLGAFTRSSQSITAVAVATGKGVFYQYDNNSQELFTSTDLWGEWNQDIVQEAFKRVSQAADNRNVPKYVVMTEPRVHPARTDRGLLHIAFPVRGKQNYHNIEYMIIITYNSEVLEGPLRQLNEHRRQVVQALVSDSEDKMLYHEVRSLEGMSLSEYLDKEQLKNLSKELSYFGWKLNLAIDENELHKQVNDIYERSLWLFALLIGAILIAFSVTTQHILKPVGIIGLALKRVKEGNMREEIDIRGNHEIWKLADEYNEMMKAIRAMNREVQLEHEKVVDSLKMKQQAEREALESQINAHFICNTLNAINYEAMENGNHKVSVLLKKLSNILRYTFDQKHQNVYMFQEISWVEQYLFLQKERLENTFEYEIQFEPSFESWPCRKLMLQPFIENSILHGFEGRQEGGKILIQGSGEEGRLKLVIEDNGVGMSPDQEKKIQEVMKNPVLYRKNGGGIGISNVLARMYMYYGEEMRIALETGIGKGTRFIFYIPKPGEEGK